jgi:hypothetical protein
LYRVHDVVYIEDPEHSETDAHDKASKGGEGLGFGARCHGWARKKALGE